MIPTCDDVALGRLFYCSVPQFGKCDDAHLGEQTWGTMSFLTSYKDLGFYWNHSQPLAFSPTLVLIKSAQKDTSSLSLSVEKLLYTCQCKDVMCVIKTRTVHTSERPCLIPPPRPRTKSTIHLFLLYYGNESVPILILTVFNIAFFANYRMPDPDFTVRDVKLLVGELFWMHWINSIQNRIAFKYLSSCVCRHLW